MNMSTIYADRHLVSEDRMAHFEEHRKQKLSMVEKIGLEAVLCEFAKQYEEETYGGPTLELRDYTRWLESSIDILDGIYDTYTFDDYAISEIWIAYDDCIMLSCYELKHPDYEDVYDILNYTDWQSECKPVLFRLD